MSSLGHKIPQNSHSIQKSYHDHFAVLELADKLGLLAVPLLDVDQLVTLHANGGLNRGEGRNVLTE